MIIEIISHILKDSLPRLYRIDLDCTAVAIFSAWYRSSCFEISPVSIRKSLGSYPKINTIKCSINFFQTLLILTKRTLHTRCLSEFLNGCEQLHLWHDYRRSTDEPCWPSFHLPLLLKTFDECDPHCQAIWLQRFEDAGDLSHKWFANVSEEYFPTYGWAISLTPREELCDLYKRMYVL